MPKARKRHVVLAMVGDPHMGSATGILPPEGFENAEGNRILPSPVQRWLWSEVWEPMWQWVEQVRKEHDADLYGLCNGDAVDTHALARILTREPEEQAFIVQQAFRSVLNLPFSKFYIIRGTASHVGGEAASGEESMGRLLAEQGLPVHRWRHQWTAWEMEAEFYGTKVQVAHHGRSGTKQHTMQSNAAGWAIDIANSYRESGLEPPALVVRSHTHTFTDSGASLINPTRYLILPPLQIKNAFAHKVSAHRPVHLCAVGGVVAIFYPQGGYTLRAFTRKPAAPKPVVTVA